MTDSTKAILPNSRAVRHIGNKGLRGTFSHWDSLAEEHAIAFTVAKMMDGDLLAETHAAIQDALQSGSDFNAFKNRLKPYLMSRGWWGEQVMGDPLTGEIKKVQLGSHRRLRTIYHTNLHSAYAAGQWQRIQETKAALPYLQYMPSMSEHPRHDHRRYYGLVRPVDDPIWQSIMPPNGYGCLCWVKQLSKARAEKIGISEPMTLETEKVVNKRTGEVLNTAKGIDPSFNHHHDRLGAMRKLYAEKLKTWGHVSNKTAYQQAFDLELNRYMLDLVEQPDFNSMVPTVVGQDFARRFNELVKVIKTAGGNRSNSVELQNKFSRGENWVLATLSDEFKQILDVKTSLIQLSDSTLIKEICNHPEILSNELFNLFKDSHRLLKNADCIIQEKDFKIMYLYHIDKDGQKKWYRASVKATQDKKELYLGTLFKTNKKQMNKLIEKAEKENRILLKR